MLYITTRWLDVSYGVDQGRQRGNPIRRIPFWVVSRSESAANR